MTWLFSAGSAPYAAGDFNEAFEPGYLQEFEKWVVFKLSEGGERHRGNTRKTKRTQAREYPMSVSVLSCCSFSATDSSCTGHKKPTGKKLFFSDSGAISRPDFFR